MSREFDKSLTHRFVEAWDNRDLELMDRITDELFAEDLIQHVPDMPELAQGIAPQKTFMHDMIAKNPDFHITLHEVLSDGDKLVHRGTFQVNNPTTGAVESLVWLEIDRLVDGKIAEVWSVNVPGSW